MTDWRKIVERVHILNMKDIQAGTDLVWTEEYRDLHQQIGAALAALGSAPTQSAPHVPAAFINVVAEEGTREELVKYLQQTWNELCQARSSVPQAEADALRRKLQLHAGDVQSLSSEVEMWRERALAAEEELARKQE